VRQARGLSLEHVAERSGVDIGELSRAERGLGGLSIPALRRVARVLGLRELYRLLGPYDRGEAITNGSKVTAQNAQRAGG
jgi:transcriptional regulator with XRE-family HTH domain